MYALVGINVQNTKYALHPAFLGIGEPWNPGQILVGLIWAHFRVDLISFPNSSCPWNLSPSIFRNSRPRTRPRLRRRDGDLCCTYMWWSSLNVGIPSSAGHTTYPYHLSTSQLLSGISPNNLCFSSHSSSSMLHKQDGVTQFLVTTITYGSVFEIDPTLRPYDPTYDSTWYQPDWRPHRCSSHHHHTIPSSISVSN